MKKLNIAYWLTSALLVPILGIGSIMDIMKNPDSVEILTSLGYPGYLVPFLGSMRLLGLVTIFLPKFPKLKEWAYAGLTFDIVGAIYSLLAFGHPLSDIIFPIAALLILWSSYLLYHKRLVGKVKTNA